jgi:hypothetical protein
MRDQTSFRSAVTRWAAGEVAAAADARAMAAAGLRTAVLVEGVSDQVALETLATLRGRNLDAEGITVLPMNGATNVGKFLDVLGPRGLAIGLAGLCDAGEERFFQRGIERAGLGTHAGREQLEQAGFYVCVDDLEHELIRTLGAAAVERVVEREGDLRSFRTLQKQPVQRSWTVEQQLRRFMGSIGGRKARYARALVEALGDSSAPRPLELLLSHLDHSLR